MVISIADAMAVVNHNNIKIERFRKRQMLLDINRNKEELSELDRQARELEELNERLTNKVETLIESMMYSDIVIG
jgi:hypothetical protein